jgi:hypothetical protein
MTRLHIGQCELTYEGAFVQPAFSLVDAPGKLCDLLLDALVDFGLTSADLSTDKGGEPSEPSEWRVTCDVNEIETQASLHGDRIEVHCANFSEPLTARVATILENTWSRLAALNAGPVPKTHSFLIEADAEIRGASYQELLNRLARPPESLPPGTETAIVYYLPREPERGYVESSLVLNHAGGIEHGLEINATLVFEASVVKPAASIAAARNRFRELLQCLQLQWTED